ncbi:MAG: GerMN domain-containing protein [Acidimicrobiales bacterium]
MRRLAVAIALGVTALAAAGCGIPLATGPQELARSAMPQALTQQQAPPAPNRHPDNAEDIYIYLIAEFSGDLVAVSRTVSPHATVQGVIDELEAGPLSTEYHSGDESAISTGSKLVGKAPVKGIATVRLDRRFFQLEGEAPVQELGQIVWTLTKNFPEIKAISFAGPHGPIPVETDTGRFVSNPVSAKNYCNLVAGACAALRSGG